MVELYALIKMPSRYLKKLIFFYRNFAIISGGAVSVILSCDIYNMHGSISL